MGTEPDANTDSTQSLKKENSKVREKITMAKLAAQLSGIGVVVGFIAIYFYCAFIIEFYPGNITRTDYLRLIYIAAGFAIISGSFGLLGLSFGRIYSNIFPQNINKNYTQKDVINYFKKITKKDVFTFSCAIIIGHLVFWFFYNYTFKITKTTPILSISINSLFYGAIATQIKKNKITSYNIGDIISCAAITLPLTILYEATLDPNCLMFIMVISLSGITFHVAIENYKKNKNDKTAKNQVIYYLILTLAIPYGLLSFKFFEDAAKDIPFRTAGIYKNNVTILITPKALDNIKINLIIAKKQSNPCMLNGKYIIDNVEILWTGIGDKSLFSLNGKTRFTLRNQDFNIIETQKDSGVICIRPEYRPYFPPSSPLIQSIANHSSTEINSEAILISIVKKVESDYYIDNIYLSGQADTNESSNTDGSGLNISYKRALTIRDIIRKTSSAPYELNAAGSKLAKQECKDNYSDECNYLHRTVDVLFFVTQKKENSGLSKKK